MMHTAQVSVCRMYRLMLTVCLPVACRIKAVAGVASIGGQVTNRPSRFVGMLVAGLSGIVDLLTPCLVVLLQAIV